MSTDTSSSEDESLAAYAAVAVSGDAVRANAAESGAKAVKVLPPPPPGFPGPGIPRSVLSRRSLPTAIPSLPRST